MRYFLLLWTSPNTLFGILIGLIGIATGSQFQMRRGCLEFSGGFVKWLLKKMPTGSGAMAMTLGHVILGQTPAALDATRDHEHVHVKQYERWGPFFVPAYLLSSAYVWWRGGNSYLDNPFEIEAYSKTTIGPIQQDVSE